MNYFDILGVSVDDSTEHINDAYRRLARQFHPDQHPEASAAERARWTDAMASINAAWEALKDPIRRAQYRASIEPVRASSSGGRQAGPTYRAARVGECDLCGSGPATQVVFKHQHAYLIRATVYTSQLELCRGCALALGRARQNRTLIAGWWGVLSFFRNLGIVWTNTIQLRRAARLTSPTRSPEVVTPLATPLPQGRSVFGRFGFWFTMVVVAIIATAIAGSASQPESVGSNLPVGSNPSVGWATGNCIAGSGPVYPVSCSAPHVGQIVARVTDRSLCSVQAESYVEDAPWVWCIDENL
jgi:hypothetical protein